MEYEVDGPRPRGRPKRTWREVVKEDCQACKLNTADAMDRARCRKLIKDIRWSGWVWVGDCFFWYWPTRVVPDQRPLNGCVCVCERECWSAVTLLYQCVPVMLGYGNHYQCVPVMLGYGSGERAHGLWLGGQDSLQRPHITVFSAHAEGMQKSLHSLKVSVQCLMNTGVW